ncbi:MAG: thioredoxin family protein [Planctomycetes bacterium]|nr:thioredoxin family protein [Planctomycetota bacterium]
MTLRSPWFATFAVLVSSSLLAAAPAQDPVVHVDASPLRDALAWYRGTLDEALVRARAEGRQVVLVFQRNGCKRCEELVEKTLVNPAVVAELADSLCLSIDGESTSGAPLVARFGVAEYPTLVWLSPDGSLRDRVVGVLGATELLREAQRIRSDRETVGELRRRVAADEGNVDLRWRLSQKLRAAGDGNGAQAEIERIKKLDPTGRSKPMRLMRLDDLRTQVRRTYDETRGAFDTQAIVALLERDLDPEVLYRGWTIVADFEAGALARIQKARLSTPAQAAAARGRRRSALKSAWPHCPVDELVSFGNGLAWSFYEAAEELAAEDRAFALAVAERVAERAGDQPPVLDTLACCLYMNDRKADAVALVRRCIELDPSNDQWPARLVEFAP